MFRFLFRFASSATQGALLPLPHPPDQARQLRHRGQRGEHGLRPAGGQAEQGRLGHRGGHRGRPAAAQVSIHLRRSARTLPFLSLAFLFFVFVPENICAAFLSSLLSPGLGHLISCILINGAQYFKRISESGIKKMCRNIFVLQQNLTNITMSREADLDFARSVRHFSPS